MATAIWVVEDDENIAELIKTALLSASYEVRVLTPVRPSSNGGTRRCRT